MKKVLFFLMLGSIVTTLWADPATVSVSQTFQAGNKVLKPNMIPTTTVKDKSLRVRYDFTVKPKYTSSEQAVILCRITVPKDIKFTLSEFDGVVVNTDDTPCITKDGNSFVILLPKKVNATAHVTFDIDNKKLGTDIKAVNFEFTHYQRPQIWTGRNMIGIAVGTAAGITTGILSSGNVPLAITVGVIVTTITDVAIYKLSKKTIGEVIKKYEPTPMPFSSKHLQFSYIGY
ncbi:MAG: hypothetical protein J6U56_09335 [Spirochaetia bacterium]|nr:hypothetical protein [Spirochaetia bacterium]